MEVLDYTEKEMARRMKTSKFLLVAMALATVLMVAFFSAVPTQAQTSSSNASHQKPNLWSCSDREHGRR